MTASRARVAWIVVTGAFVVAPAVLPAQRPSAAFPEATIEGSQVRTLRSAITGTNYEIDVLLPASYAQDSTRHYPVLYVLDGQWDFKLLCSVEGGLVYDKWMPEMIIVGITYVGRNLDYNALRAVDYTPVAAPGTKGSGGGPKFLRFLKAELLPFVASNYRVDDAHRMLLGNSLGGLFAIYAMLTEPDLFAGYIASSPAVTFGNRDLFARERAYAASHDDVGARLFIGVGGAEELSRPVQEFMETLRERGYPALHLETMVFEGEGHTSNKPETYNRGVRFVARAP
ncbi:MAG TPA: alpha/beta hydrolase-fold protein [Gemmatimonadaceae bacterium]